jgi:hypothetical protein
MFKAQQAAVDIKEKVKLVGQKQTAKLDVYG